MLSNSLKWNTISISKSDIHLGTILRAGQAFRWRKLDNIWSCLINEKLILLDDSNSTQPGSNFDLKYTTLSLNPVGEIIETPKEESLQVIEKYLNLSNDLNTNQLHWSRVDPHFPQLRYPTPDEETGESTQFIGHGVRILVQDPWEVLISFIISSNNNIKRISQLCETLCISHGKIFGEFNEMPYYFFPQPTDLFKLGDNNKCLGVKDIEIDQFQLDVLEEELRRLGFGYRARYISTTAAMMLTKHENWIKLTKLDWKKEGDEQCVEFLKGFTGVGPKVADCVALMGCGCHDLVPIDTHVWKIVQNVYKQEFINWISTLKVEGDTKTRLRKSLSNKAVDVKLYPFVKLFFKDLWQINAGWAQAVVFAGEVKLENGINSEDDFNRLLQKISGTPPGKKLKVM